MLSKNPRTTLALEELSWQDAEPLIRRENPTLADIINDINLDKRHTLFKVSYPFGSEFVQKGCLYLPTESGHLLPITSPDMNPVIKEKLGYNLCSNPMSFILSNTAELYIDNKVNPLHFYGLIEKGNLFSTWRTVTTNSQQPAFIWTMTAGARFLFMLPKFSEKNKHNKLRQHFKISAEAPRTLMDHWKVFKDIAKHASNKNPWKFEILYFSKDWVDLIRSSEGLSLRYYILDQSWRGSEFWRHQFIWNIVFSHIQQERNMRISPHIIDTAKQLIWIAAGAVPGYAPAIDDRACPIKFLQDAYRDIYQLQNYTPTIMQPQRFSPEENRSVYYSLGCPTTIELSLRSRIDASKISDLYETRSVLNKFLSGLAKKDMNLEGSTFYDRLQQTQFDFFHPQKHEYSGIYLCNVIPTEDTHFGAPDQFADSSPFMSGCIRIKTK